MNQKMPTAKRKATAPKISTVLNKPPCPHEHFVVQLFVRYDGDAPVEHSLAATCMDCNAFFNPGTEPLNTFFETLRESAL